MEKVIHKMTGAVVDRYGIKERGFLEAGYKADITVFDPEGLKVYPEEPGRKADGIRYVFVNGQCAVDPEGFHPQRSGQLILKKKA
jgi:N-acyl-D-aspartate/D-glutamate deacylase